MLPAVAHKESICQGRVDMKLSESRQLQVRSHTVIPGGAHTYAEGRR